MNTSLVGRRALKGSDPGLGSRKTGEFGSADRDESRRTVIWFAVLLALPLAVLGILAALLIGADYAVTRTHELGAANQEITRLDAVMQRAIDQRADSAITDIRTAAQNDRDTTNQIRLATYTDEARFALVTRDNRRLFPPSNGATPAEQIALQRFSAAIAAAHSEMNARGNLAHTETGFWTADSLGLSFVRCMRERDIAVDICVVFDESALDPVLEVSLNTATQDLTGWSLTLRDPTGGALWTHGTATTSTSAVADLTGSMSGWHMEASPPPGTHWGFLPLTAIIVPLLGCWFFVVWHVQRGQAARLKESNFRSEMTARLSHDLRTPIANLRLYADLALRRADDSEAVQRYCEIMSAEIERLSLLADNTVVYGRGAVPRPLRLDEAVPDTILDTVIERYQTLFSAAGSTIEVSHRAPTLCRFDRMGFERILINLLDNACKYAPGQIEVATSQDAHTLILSVRDFGPGFDEAYRAKLDDSQKKGKKDGFGLGLAVVRDLAEANGGKIAIENCDPGARVTVTMKTTAPSRGAEA
ncbi:MAG TPA: HAMP domain-containing sensor histidine kinase [Methylovirgula sp.]